MMRDYIDSTDNTTNTSELLSAMWAKSCELFPELAVIQDNDARHKVLMCSTKEAQDEVLREYLSSQIAHNLVREAAADLDQPLVPPKPVRPSKYIQR